MADRVIEELDEDQCLDLISGGGIGRIAYASRFAQAVPAGELRAAGRGGRVPHRGERPAR